MSGKTIDPKPADGAAAPREVLVFICYRREDGSEAAEWLFDALDGGEYLAGDGSPRRIRCYYDVTAPGVADWKKLHFPSLQAARALVFVSTPGAAKNIGSRGSPDWVHEELAWWVGNRGEAPAVIDTTGDARWIPSLLVGKWPDLNRIALDLDRVDPQSERFERETAERVTTRLIDTFRESEAPTVFEDLEREKTLNRKRQRWLRVTLALLGVVATLALVAAGLWRLAVAETRKATSLRLATEAETAERVDLALILAAAAYRLDDSAATRHSLLDGLLTSRRLRAFLNGDQGRVWGVAWSADGRRLASSSDDGSLIVWDIATLRPVARFGGGEDPVARWAVAFSADSSRLASGDNLGEIALWRIETGAKTVLAQVGTKVLRVAFSPDGSRLAAASRAGAALWDLTTEPARPMALAGGPEAPADAAKREAWGLAFSPDGRHLAVAGQGSDATFGPDSDWWAAQNEPGAVTVWDAVDGSRVWGPDVGHDEIATSAAFSPDGRLLATGGEDGAIILRDTDDYRRTARLTGVHRSVWSVVFHPDSSILATGGENDGTIAFWSVHRQASLPNPLVGSPGSLWTIAFDPSGSTLAASVEAGGGKVALTIPDLGPAPPAPDTRHPPPPVALSPDHTLVAIGDRERAAIRLQNPASASPLAPRATVWSAVEDPRRTAPDGQTLELSSPLLEPVGEPFTWDGSAVRALALGPGGVLVAAAEESSVIRVWSASGQATDITTDYDRGVHAVAVDPAGARLAAGGHDRGIRFWSLASGERLSGELPVSEMRWVRSITFAPDGRRLAAGDRFGGVTLWDLETGRPLGDPLEGQEWEVACDAVAFSADGELLAAGYRDGGIGIWDLASSRLIGRLIGAGPVTEVAFSADGRQLVSGNDRGVLTLWDVDPASWHRRLCERVNRNLTCNEKDQYLGGVAHRTACPQNPTPVCDD